MGGGVGDYPRQGPGAAAVGGGGGLASYIPHMATTVHLLYYKL